MKVRYIRSDVAAPTFSPLTSVRLLIEGGVYSWDISSQEYAQPISTAASRENESQYTNSARLAC